MIDLTLTVETLDGETWEAKATFNVLIKFEQKFKTSALKALSADGLYLEHLGWLAWESSRAAGRVVPTYEKFCETLGSVTGSDDTAPLPGTA
tara:strand:- start:216 stop:491 length:276 start_codon:yes stop_codon:yes gene_type:complete